MPAPRARVAAAPRRLTAGLALGVLLGAPAPPDGAAEASAPRAVEWTTLADGMALARVGARRSATQGDSTITLVRIDPELWEPVVVAQSATGRTAGLSAREWAREHGLAVATNAGMFATDHKTHIGYLRAGEHVNNGRFNAYRSVAAFGRLREGLPRFRIFDLDVPGVTGEALRRDYASLLQNLRLVKRPGENRWPQQEKRWSEAALGEDTAGRMLLIFCRSPYSMHDLNRELLALDIGLVAAQHLEGGRQAQLWVAVGGREIELVGGPESRLLDGDARPAWPIPNVLGVRRRAP